LSAKIHFFYVLLQTKYDLLCLIAAACRSVFATTKLKTSVHACKSLQRKRSEDNTLSEGK